MSETNKPNYKWRPATKGDIGSIARFSDTNHEREPWTYGILVDIQPNPDDANDALKWVHQCDDGNWEDPEDREFFFYCQIQYDASIINDAVEFAIQDEINIERIRNKHDL